MSSDLAPYTSNRDLLHQALVDATGRPPVKGKYFCPFHEDGKTPNGSIHEQDGHWKFKCFSCGKAGDYFDIVAHAQGKPMADVIRETTKHDAPPPRPVKTAEKKKHVWDDLDQVVAFAEKKIGGNCTQRYKYNNPDTGNVDICVLRIEKPDGGKEFWQCHPVDGGYVLGYPEGPKRPLYNRGRIRKANTIAFVEGEKCVHALHEVGIVATCAPGGANTDMAKVDWAPLAGKTVVLWPDNDDPHPETGKIPGLEYIKNATALLETLNPEPTLLTISPAALDLARKEDAADYIYQCRNANMDDAAIRRDLLTRFDQAKRMGASATVIQRVQDIIDGLYVPVKWLCSQLSRQTRALLPGTITIMSGNPGSQKSWFVLQNAMHMHDKGESVAILMLEEDHTYWVHRAMAIRDENPDHFDEEKMQANPEAIMKAVRKHADWMDSFGKCIHVPEMAFTPASYVIKWVAEMAARQVRIIIIDPITFAVHDGELFKDEMKMLSEMKYDIRASGSSLILVTHPKQGNIPMSLNALAGSAAFQRACQTVLWLERLDEPEDMVVKRLNTQNFGNPFWEKKTVCCNRRLSLLKARNCSGTGLKLAYHFSRDTVSFHEQGIIHTSLKETRAGK